MTSNEGTPTAGDWIGVIIAGDDDINHGSDTSTFYVGFNTVTYGGTDGNDNSGTMTFGIIRYAGKSGVNYANASLTLLAIGSGTTFNDMTIDEIGANADGMRLYGGTVS